MSRSYKKHPFSTDGHAHSTKESKRCANSKVRNIKGIYKGKSYKKLFCSYDIHDWILRWTWDEAKKDWENDKYCFLKIEFPTLKEFYKYWCKCCKRK